MARNTANDPPPSERVDLYYHPGAFVRWREDGWYFTPGLVPPVPERVLIWEQAFWDQVCPQHCDDCGRPMGPGPHYDSSCLECRWTLPHHLQREREDALFYEYS
jgi:hypothetical protein